MNEARPFIETCSQRLPSKNTENQYDNRSWQPPRTKSWVLLTSISTQLSACIIEAFLVIPVVLNKNGKPNYPSSSMLKTAQTYLCVCVACVCMRVWQCVCALRNNKHSYKQIQGRVLQKIQSHYSLHYLFFCTHHHSFKCLRFLLMLCLIVAISRASVEVNKKKQFDFIPLK